MRRMFHPCYWIVDHPLIFFYSIQSNFWLWKLSMASTYGHKNIGKSHVHCWILGSVPQVFKRWWIHKTVHNYLNCYWLIMFYLHKRKLNCGRATHFDKKMDESSTIQQIYIKLDGLPSKNNAFPTTLCRTRERWRCCTGKAMHSLWPSLLWKRNWSESPPEVHGGFLSKIGITVPSVPTILRSSQYYQYYHCQWLIIYVC
jgi:hypothetical protein